MQTYGKSIAPRDKFYTISITVIAQQGYEIEPMWEKPLVSVLSLIWIGAEELCYENIKHRWNYSKLGVRVGHFYDMNRNLVLWHWFLLSTI